MGYPQITQFFSRKIRYGYRIRNSPGKARKRGRDPRNGYGTGRDFEKQAWVVLK